MNLVRTSTEIGKKKKKSQAGLKNLITEVKNTLQRINSRLEDVREWIGRQDSGKQLN